VRKKKGEERDACSPTNSLRSSSREKDSRQTEKKNEKGEMSCSKSESSLCRPGGREEKRKLAFEPRGGGGKEKRARFLHGGGASAKPFELLDVYQRGGREGNSFLLQQLENESCSSMKTGRVGRFFLLEGGGKKKMSQPVVENN